MFYNEVILFFVFVFLRIIQNTQIFYVGKIHCFFNVKALALKG
jgi:hypothetical protein